MSVLILNDDGKPPCGEKASNKNVNSKSPVRESSLQSLPFREGAGRALFRYGGIAVIVESDLAILLLFGHLWPRRLPGFDVGHTCLGCKRLRQ